MKRKFYKNEVKLIVLSEDEPIGDLTLGEIAYECDEGRCVLHSTRLKEQKVKSKTMANLLHAAGSEPSFFQLDDKGNDVDL